MTLTPSETAPTDNLRQLQIKYSSHCLNYWFAANTSVLTIAIQSSEFVALPNSELQRFSYRSGHYGFERGPHRPANR